MDGYNSISFNKNIFIKFGIKIQRGYRIKHLYFKILYGIIYHIYIYIYIYFEINTVIILFN